MKKFLLNNVINRPTKPAIWHALYRKQTNCRHKGIKNMVLLYHVMPFSYIRRV